MNDIVSLPKCILTTVYQINQTPTSVNHGRTPYEAFFGQIPNIPNLHVFYCDVNITVKKDDGAKKLGDCAKKVKFLGYPADMHGWCFWDPVSCKTIHSQSVFFIETAAPAVQQEFISVDTLKGDTPTPQQKRIPLTLPVTSSQTLKRMPTHPHVNFGIAQPSKPP
jgi:hypothetical protein